MMSSLLIAFILAGGLLHATELRIKVVDEKGGPVWTRLEVRGENYTPYYPKDAIVSSLNRLANRKGNDRYYAGSFTVEGAARLDVPTGHYKVVAEHGLEYNRVEKDIDVSAERPAEVSLQLHPWIRMRDRGWYSGDMHVHRTPQESPALAYAEELNVLIVFTMWNKQSLWKESGPPADPVVRVSPNHYLVLMDAEDERGGGAWMLHNLKKPLDKLDVDGRWYPSGIRFVREARAQKSSPDALFPWFDSEKPIWWEVPVMMALATPDSMGVAHNHFNQYSTVAHEAWGRARDRKEYPGDQGFADYSMQLYYRYLNLGFRIPPSAGAASGVLTAPPGYNRIYVPISGPLSVDKWYSAVKAGKGFVTNGPILFFETKPSGGKVQASIEAHARAPLTRIEIIANGEVIQSLKPSGKDFKSTVTIDPGKHSWIAARCFQQAEGTVRFAHTSPVYLPAQWDGSADAQYFVEWMDELIAQTKSDPKRGLSDAERRELLALYDEARRFYAAKIEHKNK